MAAGELYRFAADVLKHGAVESVQMYRGDALGKSQPRKFAYDDALKTAGSRARSFEALSSTELSSGLG